MEITLRALAKSVATLNGTKLLKEPVSIEGKELEQVKEAFMLGIESVPQADEKKLPDQLKLLYNSLANSPASSPASPAETASAPESSKKIPKTKLAKAMKEAPPPVTKKGVKKTAAPVAKTKPVTKGKAAKPAKEKANVDVWGCREGSVNSKVAEMFAAGKYTMRDIMKKMDVKHHFYALLGTLRKAGHTVSYTEDNRIVLKK